MILKCNKFENQGSSVLNSGATLDQLALTEYTTIISTSHSELQQHLYDGRPVLSETLTLSSRPFVGSVPDAEACEQGERVSSDIDAGEEKGSQREQSEF